MTKKKSAGRPNTITFRVEKQDLCVSDDNIKQLFKSRVRSFSNSGAYIPISQDYKNHEVFIIVMNKK